MFTSIAATAKAPADAPVMRETVLAGHPTTANSGIREDGTKR